MLMRRAHWLAVEADWTSSRRGPAMGGWSPAGNAVSVMLVTLVSSRRQYIQS